MSTPHVSKTHHAGENIGDDVRTAWKGFTGTGDAIRGTVNSAVDSIFHNKESDASRAKNDAIAERGLDNVRNAEARFEHGGHGGHGGHVGATGTTAPVTTEGSHATGQPPVAGTGVQMTGHHAASSGQGSHFAGH